MEEVCDAAAMARDIGSLIPKSMRFELDAYFRTPNTLVGRGVL